jgi:hypothetical protein
VLHLKATVEKELETIKKSATHTPAGRDLLQAVATSNDAIQQQFDNYADDTSARIYIHIADESQRATAQMLKKRLEEPTRALLQIVVQSIEVMAKPPKVTFLRCFDGRECKMYGTQLLANVNRRLEYPQATLQDFSDTFTDKGSIRPLHFELYFGPGDILLRGSKVARDSKAAAR